VNAVIFTATEFRPFASFTVEIYAPRSSAGKKNNVRLPQFQSKSVKLSLLFQKIFNSGYKK